MWLTIYLVFMNLFVGFWLAFELKRRYRELYLDSPVEGVRDSLEDEL